MDPILVFLIVGTFAMSASISASKLLKLPEEEQPAWMQGNSGKVRVLIGGNVFAVTLVAAFVYGLFHVTWWIPVACLFITFPVMHVVNLEKLLGAEKGFFICGGVAVASSVLIWLFW